MAPFSAQAERVVAPEGGLGAWPLASGIPPCFSSGTPSAMRLPWLRVHLGGLNHQPREGRTRRPFTAGLVGWLGKKGRDQ